MLPPACFCLSYRGRGAIELEPLTIVAGSIVSCTLVGLLTGYLERSRPTRSGGEDLIIIAFGAVRQVRPPRRERGDRVKFSRPVDGISVLSSAAHPLADGFTLGLVIGILWLPCVGPSGCRVGVCGNAGAVSQSGLLLSVRCRLRLRARCCLRSKVAGGRVRDALPGVEQTETVRSLAGVSATSPPSRCCSSASSCRSVPRGNACVAGVLCGHCGDTEHQEQFVTCSAPWTVSSVAFERRGKQRARGRGSRSEARGG